MAFQRRNAGKLGLSELKAAWSVHESAPYPEGFAGAKFGCNLTNVDSQVRAAVIAYLEHGAPPGSHRKMALEAALKELEGVAPQLGTIDSAGRSGATYFDRVLTLGYALLSSLQS